MKKYFIGIPALALGLVACEKDEKKVLVDNPEIVKELEQTKTDLADLQEKVKKQEADVLSLTGDREKLEEEKTALEKDKAELEKKIAELETTGGSDEELEKLKQDLKDAEAALAGVKDDLEKVNKDLKAAQDEAKKAKDERDKIAQESQAILELYKDTSSELLDYMLTNELTSYEDAAVKVADDLIAISEDDLIVAGEENVATAKIELDKATDVLESAAAGLMVVEGDLEFLKTVLDAGKDADLIAAIDTYFAEKAKQAELKGNLEIQESYLKALQDDLATTEKNLETNQASLKETKEELAEVSNVASPDLDKIAELKSKISNIELVISKIEEKIVDLGEQIGTQQTILDASESALNTQNGVVEGSLANVDAAKAEMVEEARAAKADAEEKVKGATSALEQAQADLEAVSGHKIRLEKFQSLLNLIVDSSDTDDSSEDTDDESTPTDPQ